MRILWIKSELLHPLDKGGKIRTYQMLKHLRREHDITYLSFVDQQGSNKLREKASEYCDKLVTVESRAHPRSGTGLYRDVCRSLLSNLPYAIWKYGSRAMQSAIELEVQERDYDVVVADFLVASINLPCVTDSATVLFQHNVESTIWQRHFETQTNRLKRVFLRDQWQRMVRYERAACQRFDAVVGVSELDAERMRREFGLRRVFDVPTGVDTGYFKPAEGAVNPFELVFTGSMDWVPNEDAILFFVDQIMPIVSQAIPECSLTVVGRNPGPALKQLAHANPRVRILGGVEDVRQYISSAAAYVVPIRIGGGTRLKIFEAMAMGKPVISTSVGAEGLPIRDGRELLIADRPEDFAKGVERLLRDTAFAKSLGENARVIVCENFGWEHAAARFAEICEEVGGKESSRRVA